MAVGASEGDALGGVGEFDGALEGVTVGTLDGDVDGMAVGTIDGYADGTVDGMTVVPVGMFVGASLGNSLNGQKIVVSQSTVSLQFTIQLSSKQRSIMPRQAFLD